MAQHNLKYRTFDQLLDEVSTDFMVYSLEGMIEPAQLIKVAQKVTYDLGLRIHMGKRAIIDISNGRGQLPSDFHLLNYAVLCHKYTVYDTQYPSGRHTEDVLRTEDPTCTPAVCPEDPCKPVCPNVCVEQCTNEYQVVERVIHETRVYHEYENIRIRPGRNVAGDCFNCTLQCARHGEVRDGFIYLDIKYGKLYIEYLGAMEDEEGNLLVLDHPMINEYYEFALKERILQNLYMNGEEVQQKLQFIKQELRAARNNALTIVNTPDFAELKAVFDMNRTAMYRKYYYQFAS